MSLMPQPSSQDPHHHVLHLPYVANTSAVSNAWAPAFLITVASPALMTWGKNEEKWLRNKFLEKSELRYHFPLNFLALHTESENKAVKSYQNCLAFETSCTLLSLRKENYQY